MSRVTPPDEYARMLHDAAYIDLTNCLRQFERRLMELDAMAVSSNSDATLLHVRVTLDLAADALFDAHRDMGQRDPGESS